MTPEAWQLAKQSRDRQVFCFSRDVGHSGIVRR
jgi:hypothetical protein